MQQTNPFSVPDTWKRFLRMYICFSIFSVFMNNFITTFMLKSTGDDTSMTMLYNIILAAVQPFAMVAAVHLIRKKTALFSQCVGLGLFTCVFLILMVLGENAVRYYYILGAVFACGNGFFFVTYALQLQAYTRDINRDKCYGLQNIVANVIGLCLPILTGLLLKVFTDFTGYTIMFAMGLIASMGSIWFTMHLDPITEISPRPELGKALSVLLHNRYASAAMLTSSANGFYDGIMLFFLPMLMFRINHNESITGFYTAACALAALAASFVYGKAITPSRRTPSVAISLSSMILLTVALAFIPESGNAFYIATLFVYGVVLKLLSTFFVTPPLMSYFKVVERLPDLHGLAGEVHTLREFWYGTGRVLGILMAMLLMKLSIPNALIILVVLLVQLIPAFLMKRMEEVC